MKSLTPWLCVGFIIRLLVILYGVVHDSFFNVRFTDVDYEVFSDAAEFVSMGKSPYDRDTYRYPPLVAWLLIPNDIFPLWGKIIFSGLDIVVSMLLFSLVRTQGFSEVIAKRCALMWLLNPVSVIISARGNSDSIIAALVLLALNSAIKVQPATAGLLLGLAIHTRLYPIAFSLPIYLSFRQNQSMNLKKIISDLLPNKNQFILVFSCVSFLISSTLFCYYLYGDKFINESILYHLTRKDIRHNFSLFFYLLYLNPHQSGFLLFFPQAIILLVTAVAYHHRKNLAFCIFVQSFIMVTYNPVVTSQYWIWVLSLLPASIPRLNLSLMTVAFLSLLWLSAQLAWLVPAFLLEFRGRNTFIFIWFQSIGVFCANIAVLRRIVRAYQPSYVSKTVKSE